MKLSSIAIELGASYVGNGDIEITSLAFNKASSSSIIYISSISKIPKNYHEYGAIICPSDILDFLPRANIIHTNQHRIAFAELTNLLKKKPTGKEFKKLAGYLNCFVAESTVIGKKVVFGCNVVIEENVSIGNMVNIGHNVVIHSGSRIGNNVNIDSGTIIGSEGFGNVLDKNKNWKHIYHHGNVVIGNNVSIGSNCSIDRGTLDNTIINNGVIIDNQVHIAHNVVIGEKTAIAANTGIAGSCIIGKRNMIGGMVGIIDHINTVDDVIISATSTVNKDIKESGTYTGIMPISCHANWKRIALWITKLDKIAKNLNLKRLKL